MPDLPLNDDLNELVTLLGENNVRALVRTFLREYPLLLQQLADGDRKTRHRIAHSLKSNARVIGARILSARMAEIEERLNSAAGSDLAPADIASIRAEFDAAALPLRPFAADP
jgi:HPt (histidine-containing phosphotransfer) domain-containing protein